MSGNEPRQRVVEVIADALALSYGCDGESSISYWGDGAELALTMLIEAGWLPAEADHPGRNKP